MAITSCAIIGALFLRKAFRRKSVGNDVDQVYGPNPSPHVYDTPQVDTHFIMSISEAYVHKTPQVDSHFIMSSSQAYGVTPELLDVMTQNESYGASNTLPV